MRKGLFKSRPDKENKIVQYRYWLVVFFLVPTIAHIAINE